MKASYYDRLRAAAVELFGEDADFQFCSVQRRNRYHRITRGGETLANIRLKDYPPGLRIIRAFESAAEAVGNVDLASLRPILKKHGVLPQLFEGETV